MNDKNILEKEYGFKVQVIGENEGMINNSLTNNYLKFVCFVFRKRIIFKDNRHIM